MNITTVYCLMFSTAPEVGDNKQQDRTSKLVEVAYISWSNASNDTHPLLTEYVYLIRQLMADRAWSPLMDMVRCTFH